MAAAANVIFMNIALISPFLVSNAGVSDPHRSSHEFPELSRNGWFIRYSPGARTPWRTEISRGPGQIPAGGLPCALTLIANASI